MKFRALLFLVLALTVRGAERPPPLIVISLDGFRWDYCELFPAASPTLRQLRREGVSVRGLIPVFPSNTFPNHYSIVTGLYPAKHGIIDNSFFDPALGQLFRFNQPHARDSRWWAGEPIWVTAIKQGHKAATSFWVGSDAEVTGVRPTFWRAYDETVPFEKRLEEVSGWLRLPPEQRPSIITFYLEETNGAGHRFGPASPEVAAAIKLCDERVATLLARLRAEGVEPNLMVISDHGMTATSGDRTVVLDDILDLKTVQIDAEGTALALRPLAGDISGLVAKFARIARVKAYRMEDLPERFHLRGNARIAPVWVLPEEGWHIGSRATIERARRRYPEKGYMAGDHGYDPQLPAMRGIFFAHGPAFRRGVELPEVENVHLYNLMCAALKLKPAPNDGDNRLVQSALRE